MRKANPWRKFFVNDLYVEEGEPVNAFWGMHLANNIAKLLNVDGTLFFGTLARGEGGGGAWVPRFADVLIEPLQLSAAPIVQFSAWNEFNFVIGTVLAEGTQWAGTLAHNLNKSDRTFTVRTAPGALTEFFMPIGWETTDIGAMHEDQRPWSVLKLGTTTDELMHVGDVWRTSRANENDLEPYDEFTFEVTRGYAGSPQAEHSHGDVPFAVGRKSFTATTLNLTGLQYSVNPPFVEAYLDQTRLRIKWMHDLGGTLYFKIFGV